MTQVALTKAEMAERLFVSPNTIKTHIKNIYRKIEINNRNEAIAYAEKFGLI